MLCSSDKIACMNMKYNGNAFVMKPISYMTDCFCLTRVKVTPLKTNEVQVTLYNTIFK